MGGIDKLRYGGLSEFALKHFKVATTRERVPRNSVFMKFKLFADIMVICFTDNFNGTGACFRSFEHLRKKERDAIMANIGFTIRIMEIEEINTDDIKQLTYNIWSKCCNFALSDKIVHEKDPIQVLIDTGKIPSEKKLPAHLQIGTSTDSSPIYIFIWFNKSLFIRKNHTVFTIPALHIEQVKNKIVRIKLQERDGRWVCLYGNEYANTADRTPNLPVQQATKLLDSLKTKNGRDNSISNFN